MPSVRAVAWLLRKPEAACRGAERSFLEALGAVCPALGEARALALRFGVMLSARDMNALRPWLADAERGALRSFAASLRRDFDAVLAALCFPWSNGQVEGQVHRIKLVKRSMFGRAGFPCCALESFTPPEPRYAVTAGGRGAISKCCADPNPH